MALHLNIELARLQWTYQQVDRLIAQKDSAQKYRALTRKLPSMIQTNGILNTLLFLKGKAKTKNNEPNEHQLLLNHLVDWSKQAAALIDPFPENNWIGSVLNKNSTEIRQLNREYLLMSGYLKRVAEALIEEKEPQKKENA